jgi:lipopolysaccharide export LptBFGC system permease protein LptF
MKLNVLPVIQRAVTREMVITFIFSSVVIIGMITLISIFQTAYRYEDLGADVLMHLVPIILTYAVAITLPVSFLLVVTFTFSRMEADNEITTLQVSGVHILTVLSPSLLLALLLSIATFALQIEILPNAHLRERTVIRKGLHSILTNLTGGERTIRFHPQFKVHFQSAQGNRVREIFIEHVDTTKGELRAKIHASEGVWNFDERTYVLHLDLRDCQITEYKGGRPKDERKVTTEVFPFEIDFNRILARRPKRLNNLTLDELSYVREVKRTLPDEAQSRFHRRWSASEVDVEYHKRFSEALAPVIFVLIGAPLGIMVRSRSRLVAFFAGFLPILVCYYPLMMLGANLGNTGKIPPWMGTWAANIVLGYVGFTLTARLFRR